MIKETCKLRGVRFFTHIHYQGLKLSLYHPISFSLVCECKTISPCDFSILNFPRFSELFTFRSELPCTVQLHPLGLTERWKKFETLFIPTQNLLTAMASDPDIAKNTIEVVSSETETVTKGQKCKIPNVSELLAKYFRW